MDRNKLLNGIGGNVWVDGELLCSVKSVDFKLTGNFSDIACCGDPATYAAYEGYAGEGTLETYKMNSSLAAKTAEGFRSGVIPDTKIITKVENRATGQAERWALTGVVFTEASIAKFEAQKTIEESFPIKFSHAENLETIKG